MPGIRTVVLLLLLLATACTARREREGEVAPRLVPVATYRSGSPAGLAVVSVQEGTQRAVVAHGGENFVDLLDLADPGRPERIDRHRLPCAPGESLRAVAFHPSWDYYAAVIRGAGPRAPGRLLLVRGRSGEVLAEVETGVGPDAVAIDPSGGFAVTADEAEDYYPVASGLASEPGTVTVVDLRRGPLAARALRVALPELTVSTGPEQRRVLLRPVAREGEAGAEEIPLTRDAAHVEPESVAIAPDGATAYVTLQENNCVCVVELSAARVLAVFGAGATSHPADARNDGRVSFSDSLTALREPDGVAVTPDGLHVVTADEGDTDSAGGGLSGGGRTLSVFDAQTGELAGDTGNQIDEAAHAAGVYPDHRSESRGSEPEGVAVFLHGDVPYAVVGLERASGLALVDLARPRRPRVLGVYPLPPGSAGPEGIAIYRGGGRTYVLCANERSGDLSIFEVREAFSG